MNTQKIIILEGGPSAGINHIGAIIANGVEQRNILVIEHDEARIATLHEKWPNIQILSKHLDDVTEDDLNDFSPELTLVDIGSMTPGYIGHADAIIWFVQQGFRYIMCDKPLCMNYNEAVQIQLAAQDAFMCYSVAPQIYTAYLLPCSPAVNTLIERISQSGLKLIRAESVFSKDRRKEAIQRACHSVLHDLIIHNIAVVEWLINALYVTTNQVSVVGQCGYEPFVVPELQQAAHDACPSIPLFPASTANAVVTYDDIQHIVSTSFIGESKRSTTLWLGIKNEDGSATEVVKAEITFDARQPETAGGGMSDFVDFTVLNDNSIGNFDTSQIACHKVNKLKTLFELALQQVGQDQFPDRRLFNLPASIKVVQVIDAILSSEGIEVIVE